MGNSSRRRILQMSSIVIGSGIAGCAGLGSQEDDIQDSDGDGVIDSEDYAPQDPEVQEKSDVQSSEEDTSSEENTPSEEETSTEETSSEEVLADFEQGLNGFNILINEETGTKEQGDDANAERISSDSYNGQYSLKGECSKNGNPGSVVARRSGINVSDKDELKMWAKLNVGNTYGNPRIQLYSGDNQFVDFFLRDQLDKNVWEEVTFNIENYDSIRIDVLVSSGAGTPQEALVDYIRLK